MAGKQAKPKRGGHHPAKDGLTSFTRNSFDTIWGSNYLHKVLASPTPDGRVVISICMKKNPESIGTRIMGSCMSRAEAKALAKALLEAAEGESTSTMMDVMAGPFRSQRESFESVKIKVSKDLEDNVCEFRSCTPYSLNAGTYQPSTYEIRQLFNGQSE